MRPGLSSADVEGRSDDRPIFYIFFDLPDLQEIDWVRLP